MESAEAPNFIFEPRSTIKRPHGKMEASPTLEATMRAKRVSVSLTDAEIDLLHAAVRCYSSDIAVSGDDAPDGLNEISEKLLRARRRVRRS